MSAVLCETLTRFLLMLGVILTAHTTLGGAKMIFRYPPVIRDKVSQATLREFAASKAKAATTTKCDIRITTCHRHHRAQSRVGLHLRPTPTPATGINDQQYRNVSNNATNADDSTTTAMRIAMC
jgi:hypothetical protein